MTSPITTHILDLQRGKPAESVRVTLSMVSDDTCNELSNGITNCDGRITDLLPAGSMKPGTYRMRFETREYFERMGNAEIFYPSVTVDFIVNEQRAHYHIPLLLSPFGYSTYRGS